MPKANTAIKVKLLNRRTKERDTHQGIEHRVAKSVPQWGFGDLQEREAAFVWNRCDGNGESNLRKSNYARPLVLIILFLVQKNLSSSNT